MREKYVEERYPRAMVFGKHHDGMLSVTDVNDRDIATRVTAAQAETIVAAYNRLQDLVVRLALAFDEADHEAFDRFWYGTELDRTPD